MAVPTNTTQTYTRVNIREDLGDVIYSISPVDTPVLTMAKKMTATAKLHEWNTDSLANAAANKHVEGDDDAAVASAATVRPGNRTQIMKKTASVAGSLESVDSAGFKSQMAYQMQKRSKELKRDLEFALTQNAALAAGDASNAAQMAGLESWISTNVVAKREAGMANPGFDATNGSVAAPTDPTNSDAIEEPTFKSLIAECWESGGEPDVLIAGSFNRQAISGFSGIATLYRDTAPALDRASIMGSADIYVSDFSGQGGIKIMADRFMRAKTALLLDFEMLGVAYLRPFQTYELGKTGDNEKRTVMCEATLAVLNEAAHGKYVGLTTS